MSLNCRMAPTRCPSAPSADLRLSGVIASGVEMPSRSLRAQLTVVAIARVSTPMHMCFIIIVSLAPLEGDVESEDEIRRWRRGLKIRLRADRRTGVGVALR